MVDDDLTAEQLFDIGKTEEHVIRKHCFRCQLFLRLQYELETIETAHRFYKAWPQGIIFTALIEEWKLPKIRTMFGGMVASE